MMATTSRSASLFERARKMIPAGVHSNTRARAPHPLYFQRARGPYVWDVDGNRLLDLVMANGAVILGHGDARVEEAVRRALELGLTAGVEWDGAVDVAEMFLRLVPTADMVRFANSGTEAVLHALHVARHATGRVRVAKVEGSYHGWADELYVSAFPDPDRAGPAEAPASLAGSAGLHPEAVRSVVVLPFNRIAATERIIEQHAGELAAVILEPVLIDAGYVPADREYLAALRRICTRHDIVLIFDELLTGFRLAPGGAQASYGITPDLATFGKAIANGYPMAALAGREDLMRLTEPGRGPAFVGTFNGHVLPLAAASATLPLLAHGGVQRDLSAKVERLRAAFADSAARHGVEARLAGSAGHFHWYFTGADVRDYRSAARTDARRYGAFARALAERSVLCGANPVSHQAVSAAHDEEALETLAEAFDAGLRAAAAVEAARTG